MPSAHGAHIKYAWQHQPDAVLNQPNPGSGVLYPVLVASEDVRIISIDAVVTWTVQPSMGANCVVDGNAVNFYIGAPATATDYFAELAGNVAGGGYLGGGDKLGYRAFLIEGQNIAVAAVATGGTVSNLYCLVKWARLLPT